MELFKPQENLPQTGQPVWPAWAMGALGLLLIGFGLLWRKRE
jgi:LPXTG-motif cell wall-anchored protein